MRIVIRLFALVGLAFILSSCKPAYELSQRDLRLAEAGQLHKTQNAVVIASGRFYSRHLIWGVYQRSLTGQFYKAPLKPGPKTPATHIIKGSQYVNGLHRVTLLPAGTWVLYDWYSLQAHSYGYNTISGNRSKPLGRFTVKPGEVVYIGELVIRAYEDEKVKVTPYALHTNMEAARKALKSEYPKLAKKLVFRPLKLTP